MAHDRARIHDLARSYTAAWCSHDAVKVASHYVPRRNDRHQRRRAHRRDRGRALVRRGVPGHSGLQGRPRHRRREVEYHWTFTGTNTGPGGTGKRVGIPGFEEWTVGDEELVVESQGHYDQDEHDRQLERGAEPGS